MEESPGPLAAPAGGYDADCLRGRRRNRRTTNLANRLMRTLITNGAHIGGCPLRPRRMASVSMKTPRHAGQRHAPERRPSGCMAVPSFGHCHGVVVSCVTISASNPGRLTLRYSGNSRKGDRVPMRWLRDPLC
jgi:hypothetical protein